MRLFLFALSHLVAVLSFAQDGPPPTKLFERYDASQKSAALDTPITDTATTHQITRTAGDVNVIVDPRIERLMELHAEHDHVRPGYRVQIFLGARPVAEEQKKAFLQKYPELPIYVSWLAPNFRLRVGDLRTRLEAENLLKQLRVEYPGSYIVRDEIEMPRLAGEQ